MKLTARQRTYNDKLCAPVGKRTRREKTVAQADERA